MLIPKKVKLADFIDGAALLGVLLACLEGSTVTLANTLTFWSITAGLLCPLTALRFGLAKGLSAVVAPWFGIVVGASVGLSFGLIESMLLALAGGVLFVRVLNRAAPSSVQKISLQHAADRV